MIRLFFLNNKLQNKTLINNHDEKILEKYKEIAINWCEDNHVKYEKDC